MENNLYTRWNSGVCRNFLRTVIVLLTLNGKAQTNHVINGGFEVLDSCTSQMQNPFYYPYLWIKMSQSWDTLSNGGGLGYTMHRCTNPNSYTGIPANLAGGGYQETHSGDGYAYVVYFKLTPDPSVNWRGYIQQKMVDTLKAGKVYCVTYWANLINYVNYAVDELGAYFDDGSIQSISWAHEAPANPQVKSPSGVFYMDTLNWMKVQGTFTANGTESYITLGNFRLNSATTYTSLDGQSAGIASYFIDDVSVIETDLPAYAGPDQYLIPGDSVYIGRPREIGLDDDCFWYQIPGMIPLDTAAGIWVKPLVSTSYVLKQDICGYVSYDTVTVHKSGVGLADPSTGSGGLVDLLLVPNPARDEIEIQISNAALRKKIRSVAISNSLGQKIIHENFIAPEKISLDVSSLVPGMYWLSVFDEHGNRVVRKLVIDK